DSVCKVQLLCSMLNNFRINMVNHQVIHMDLISGLRTKLTKIFTELLHYYSLLIICERKYSWQLDLNY
ncbi:unnamed protein product, partial [Heterobilharzia americana]